MKHAYHFRIVLVGLAFGAALLAPAAARAQAPGVGIGTAAPDASAALDIVSSAKGALLPRLTAAQRTAIALPAKGLLVFQTDGTGSAGPGFWFNQGTPALPQWLRLTDGAGVSYDPLTGLQVGPGPVQSPPPATSTLPYTTNSGDMFAGSFASIRTEVIYTPAELTAAGLVAGPLTSLAWNVTIKNSTVPFQSFTISLGLTAATTTTTTFTTGTTQVYGSAVSTALGWNQFVFNHGTFSWDGTSSLVVQTCFANPAAGLNDFERATTSAANPMLFASSCGAATGAAYALRPVFRFTQTVASAYTLPALAGLPGQVLTQQANGSVAFADPQWTQTGNNLSPLRLSSDVGIGTSSPAQKLHVVGTAAVSDRLGIGTTAPALPLDVVNTVAGQGLGLRNAAAWDHLYLTHDGSTAFVNAGGAETGLVLRVGASGAGSYGDPSQNYREALRLLPNGNVGIGITAPSQPLDVRSAVAGTGISYGFGTSNALSLLGNGNGPYLGFFNGGVNTSALTAWVQQRPSTDADPSHLNYHNSAGTTHAFTSAAASGVRLGLNTTAPAATLHVAGGTSTVRLEGLTGTGTRVVTAAANGSLGSSTAAALDATTASNGLTLTGTNVALGGPLTAATTLTTAANALRVNVSGAGGSFAVQAAGSNALLVDANGRVGVARNGAATDTKYSHYTFARQLTADGDGQATAFAYRTRDSRNDGTAYADNTTNSALKGYNFWGDVYTFGTSGFCDNDFTRTGGVLGAVTNGTYWGSLGYRSSTSATYGVYGSAAYANGAGRPAPGAPAGPTEGIGLGIYGGALGGWVRGEALGLVSSGRVFAAYHLGDEYTSGRQVELTTTATGQRQASFSMTAAESKTYADGVARLENGRAAVAWPAGFAALLGGVPVVTVTPVGECRGLHLVSRDATGFVVAENGRGEATLDFTWMAVAPRRDAAAATVPAELLEPGYDQHLEQVMVNDNDPAQAGAPLWHDGQRTRFTPSPASQQRPALKRELR